MADRSLDPAEQLVDGYIEGALDLTGFDARLTDITRSEPTAAARIAELLDQRQRDGRLTIADHVVLKARLESSGATRLTGHRHGGTGTRLRPRRRGADPSQPPRASIEATLQPGFIVKKRFLLEKKIGEGGMGLVFKARDIRNERYQQSVALKFLSDLLQDVPDALEALQFEVRKAHELAHPNIVTVYDFDQDGPFSFIYMELLEGQGLDKFLRKDGLGGLPFEQAWPIIQGAGAGLAYAHEKGIIHSDFKPGNVFITRDQRVKILDFGIARAAGRDAAEFDTSVLGGLTPAYASPEMARGQPPDVRDDVYALACVAYELLSGRHPFQRKPAILAQEQGLSAEPIKGLSPRRMKALERGLAFERDARTPSIVEFLADLEQKPQARTPWLRVAAAALVVAVAATAGVYSYTSSQQCAAVDAEFLDALRAQTKPYERGDDNLLAVLLEQGDEYLAEAAVDFDPTLLSEGVSNAFGAFTTVLRIDADSEAAGAGILRVIDAYRARAEQLLASGDARGAVTVADFGLKVHPRHCELNSLKTRAVAQLE